MTYSIMFRAGGKCTRRHHHDHVRAKARRRTLEALERRQLLANGYVETSLVSDQAGAALIEDPNLVNPWGIALNPSAGPVWVADNGSGVATLYSGDVSGSPFVKNPLVVDIPGGFPTGQVFNGTSDFVITAADGSSGPATFIFSTQTGELVGWKTSVPPPAPSTQGQVAATVAGADFTGLAIGQNNSGDNELYAADFQNAKIDVFDANFHLLTLASGAFTDPNLPAGDAPFNIQDVGGKLYVTYAMQQSAGEDAGSPSSVFVPGKTGGIVDVFDGNGNLLSRFSADTHLNAPWGLARAPANFGPFSGDILIANFGDGRVNAFKSDGTFDGQLADTSGNPLSVDGLRGLSFGNGVSAGDSNLLFFTAEPGAASTAPERTAVLLLDPSSQGALSAVGNGTVSVTGGGEVVVDSNNSAAVVAVGNATLAAPEFDITGVPGASVVGNANILGPIDSGVAAMADPLASLPAPAIPTQTFSGVHASGHSNLTLQPGTYTGDIKVTGQATVTLMPGLYYIEGGISVTGQGQILGNGVTIYLAESTSGNQGNGDDDNQGDDNQGDDNQGDDNQGDDNQGDDNQGDNNQGDNNQGDNGHGHGNGNGNDNDNGDGNGGDEQGGGGAISLHGHGSIVLTAPAGGALKGIALFEARDNGAPIVIDGNGSLSVTGTLYAPAATVKLSGNGSLSLRDDLTDATSSQFIADDLRVNGNGDFDMRTAGGLGAAGGAHGLFGAINAAGAATLVATSTNLTPTEGLQFTSAVAAFTSTTAPAAASDFSATIDWGDGTSSAGSVTATGNGGFLVSGLHTYAEEGTETVTVTISDTHGNTVTAKDAAAVTDAPLAAVGALVSPQNGQGGTLVVNNQVVATFVDTGGAEPVANYTATIDWGDGSATSTGTINPGVGASFTVSGSHTYGKHGRFVVTVTIVDEGGAKATVTSVVARGHTAEEDDDVFVEDAFHDVLGRDIDQGSLPFFVSGMQNGLTPAAVAALLTQSDEFLENVIRQAYLDFLGRDADDGGLRFWLGQMRHGLTDADLDADFIGSGEFFEHSGGQNSTWVNEMYFDLLGRAPDAGGQAFWVSALEHGASRSSVALGFAASLEREGQVIDSDYQTYLGRTPSQAEVNTWINAFEQGLTNEQIIAGFVGSSEYFQQQISQD